jgi:hypothetical protein
MANFYVILGIMVTPPPATDEERIRRIREITEQVNALNVERFELIRTVLPKDPEEPLVRGRLSAVVKATGWTRTYVTKIRDGVAGQPRAEE